MKIQGVIEYEGFLSSNETDIIKSKLFAVKNTWNQYDSFYTLPYGPYPGLYKNVDLNFYNTLLDQNFSDVYEKIKTFFHIFLGRKIIISDSDSRPGFHIFGPGILDYNGYNYHKDSFRKPGKIITGIIPLTSPNHNIGLNFITDAGVDLFAIRKTNFYDNVLFQRYQTGNLYIWNGDMIHSIRPFSLGVNEYRITLQFHIALHPIKKEGQLFY